MNTFKKIGLMGAVAFALFAFNACDGTGSSNGPDESSALSSSEGLIASSSSKANSYVSTVAKCPEVTSRSQFLNPNINYGELVDERDGRVYKTVKIGRQTWMAENLNYAQSGSRCADEKDENCEIYGRLYRVWNTICPEGWHIPSLGELKELLYASGKNDQIDGIMLKSRFGWLEGHNGIDTLGFSLAPVSSRNCIQANLLASGEYMYSGISDNVVTIGRTNQYYTYASSLDHGMSDNQVRCVKDEDDGESGPKVDPKVYPFWSGETKEDFFNPDVEYDVLTDERDGQTYRTVKIGDQTWMAENLNYAYAADTLYEKDRACLSISNIYDLQAEPVRTCDVFGRLYSYGAAMDSAAVFGDDGKGCSTGSCTPNEQVRGICPEGWRLPSNEDWNTLFNTAGGASVAGKKLKSRIGWNFNGNGTDDYGFSVTPSGTDSKVLHYHTAFWASNSKAEGWYFSFSNDGVYSGTTRMMHIRCLKGYTHVEDVSKYIPGVDTATVVHGTFTDERDGQVYKTVKIADQTWMAENLSYNYQVGDTLSMFGSIGYKDISDTGDIYGRYYTWPAAVDSAAVFSDGGSGCGFFHTCDLPERVRGVCPAGWHLPSLNEWKTLFSALKCYAPEKTRCGLLLKSKSDWSFNGNGFDYYGFSILPANLAEWNNNVLREIRSYGMGAYFWTSTQGGDGGGSFGISFGSIGQNVDMSVIRKTNGLSIRCVQD